MTNFITNNIAAKILCLLVALTVWAYVASGESKNINLPSSIPIEARSVGEGLIAKLSTSEIKVRVAVDRGKLKNLSADSFEAYIDLTSKTKGTYTDVAVTVKAKDPNIQIREITPSTITVTLDPAITKTVPVVVKIEGKPGDGLAPNDPIIEPDKVEVRGAKSDVDRILEATAIIGLKGDTADLKKTVALEGYDAKGDRIKDLGFSPSEVVVTIPIVKAGKSKTVGIKVKTEGTVKSGYWASQISTDPTLVSITGNAEALNSAKFIETATINIDGLSANKTFNVDLSPPTGIVLLDANTEIKVTINISANDTTKEIIASINSINLSATLSLDTSGSDPIKVLVSGPADKLDALTSADVVVTLDLNAFRSPIGVSKIDISRDWIKVPEGISVVRFNPSATTITLQSKNN